MLPQRPVIWMLTLLTTATMLAPTASAVVADTANDVTCTGGTLQICFTPVTDLGPVAVALPDVALPIDPIGHAGVVRLILVDDVLEVPSVGVDTADICEPYATLSISCEVVLSLPLVSVPNATIGPGLYLGNLVVGGATITVSTTELGTVPFADLVAGPFEDAPEDALATVNDPDGDGWTNLQEIGSGSSPIDECSTPTNNDGVTPTDLDGDGYPNHAEILLGSDPLDACSTP